MYLVEGAGDECERQVGCTELGFAEAGRSAVPVASVGAARMTVYPRRCGADRTLPT